MKAFGASHIGNSRTNQEDNLLMGSEYLDLLSVRDISRDSPYVQLEYVNEGRYTLLAVSDGMGGHASGEIASHMTVKYLAENYASMVDAEKTELISLISALNREIVSEAGMCPEYKGMGATLCGFVCRDHKILGFNVGDSRLYRFEGGVLRQLSKDHSEGQRLLDLKLLTEEELKNFPNRKAIYKYVGMRSDLVADVFDIEPCPKGTILLLCSDGLSDVLNQAEIAHILSGNTSIQAKIDALMGTALSRNVGHGDNITIILTEF